MSWKKYINVINILLLAATVSLALFGLRWVNGKAPINPPEEYQNLDSNFPTYIANSTVTIDDTNIDALLGHTGDGLSWAYSYIFEEVLLTEFVDDSGKIGLSVYNVSYLIIRQVRFEADTPFSDIDALVIADCHNITIEDSFFMNQDDAIRIEDSEDIILKNNTVYLNYNGIHVLNSPSTNISENLAVGNNMGISVADSDNSIVLNNTVVHSGSYGIHFENTDYGQISGNKLMYNRVPGALFLDGSCTFNTINYNLITDCVHLWISEGSPGDNTIENNSVTYSMKTIGLILLISAAAPLILLGFLLIRAAVKQQSVAKHFKKTKKPDEFWVFCSYATANSKMYRIKELAKRLEIFEDIDEVFFWEQQMTDDIFVYMNKYIQDCNIILLFCSAEATSSDAVEKEWMSALKINKKVVPIFKDPGDIPPLLTTKLGVKFDPEDFNKFVDDLHAMILKKTQEE